MIEAARALRDESVATIEIHEAEIARLRLLVDALEAFIEQPGSDRVEIEDTSRTSIAPAAGQGPSQPSPSPATAQPTSAASADGDAAPADRDSGPAGEEASAGGGRGGIPAASAPAASSRLTCSKCGRDDFRRPNARAMHEKHCDGVGTQRIRVGPERVIPPAGDEHPRHPSRSERYLCGRNCGASFLSREGVRAHEDEGTCRPKPTPPPADRRAGLAPALAGGIPGMGQ